MKTKSCKAKSRRLQDFIVRHLQAEFCFDTPEKIRPALMGEKGVDIKVAPELRNEIPFGIEAKNQEKLNIWSAYAQAEKNAKAENYEYPAVVFSRNRVAEPLVVIPFSVFLRYMRALVHMDFK